MRTGEILPIKMEVITMCLVGKMEGWADPSEVQAFRVRGQGRKSLFGRR